MKAVYIWIVLAPLIGSVIAGLFGKYIGRKGAHSAAILGVAIACALSMVAFKHVAIDGAATFNETIYTWMFSDGIHFQIGFLIYIPFLVIDMVVASVLLSMGMMMLPPFMVSLPFKLMLFVLIDGWYLLVGSMVKSFA